MLSTLIDEIKTKSCDVNDLDVPYNYTLLTTSALGQGKTSNFAKEAPNLNGQNLFYWIIEIRFVSCKVRTLTLALCSLAKLGNKQRM